MGEGRKKKPKGLGGIVLGEEKELMDEGVWCTK